MRNIYSTNWKNNLLPHPVFSKGKNPKRRRAGDFSAGFISELVRKYHLKKSKLGHEYGPARLVKGPKRWYIEFMIWDVQQEKLVRKRVGVVVKNLSKSNKERLC